MKRSVYCLAGMLAVTVAFAPSNAVAQRRRAAPNWRVTFTKVDVVKAKYSESDGPRVPGLSPDRGVEWIRMTAEYELSAGSGRNAGWCDSAEFSWQVVLPVADKGTASARRSIRMQRTVKYANIEADGQHLAVIYIDPRTLQRYADDLIRDLLFASLRVKIDGKTRGQVWVRGKKYTSSSSAARKLFPEFGRGPTWFESEEVREIKGALLRRDQTPWEWQSWNSYEHIVGD